MAGNSTEIKIVKIEAGVMSLHEKLDSLAESMKPVITQQKKHHEDLITLKRDRFWLFALGSAGILGPLYAFLKGKAQ